MVWYGMVRNCLLQSIAHAIRGTTHFIARIESEKNTIYNNRCIPVPGQDD